ncbi:NAD(P)-binding domain-containing protein [Streptomyces sp. 15-116A]|uniref:NAD(P)-dependent oxidoreductase n=1 Tax=Streptomyces sp. 15-116A TaxID=2259035 RepID=UPI0021B3E84B|nr:NAD(P)-binding domain-containing protein [Streptomyces sp. 15-116A]MCT7351133.1 NAD(P)-binding domain-containing protein [Streptomyces sp. 15-116A]
MTSDPQPVTILGLGNMGTALAAALLDRGHPVTVWNRSPQKAAPMTDRGARLATTPAEAISASPLVIPCVLDYDALYGLLDGATDSLTGRAVVNLTSGSPEQAHEALAWFRSHGAGYLDGAIMTTPPGVGNPEVMLLYSGPRDVFDAHRHTLAALGDPVYLDADPALASLHDAALLGLMWATMTGWLHGAALLGTEKVPATAFTPVAMRWLSTVSNFLTRYAEQVDTGRYPGDDATVDVQIAAIDHLLHASAARGLNTALPGLLKSHMERARAAGHGADSFASVISVLTEAEGS